MPKKPDAGQPQMSASVADFKPNTSAPSFTPTGTTFTPKPTGTIFNPSNAPPFNPGMASAGMGGMNPTGSTFTPQMMPPPPGQNQWSQP